MTRFAYTAGTSKMNPPSDIHPLIVEVRIAYWDGAYEDLVNSGKLGLIKRRAVREALIDYHNSAGMPFPRLVVKSRPTAMPTP